MRAPDVGPSGAAPNTPAIDAPHRAHAPPGASATRRTANQSRSITRALQRGQKVAWPSGSWTFPV
jgi:hypothetical protein